jgi:hypothetical protein
MKYNFTRLFSNIGCLFFLLITIGCDCKTTQSDKDRQRIIEKETERNKEKLALQVKEKLVGNKRLELKITNAGNFSIDVTQYSLKVQVIDVRNAKGEQRTGNITAFSQGSVSIVGSYSQTHNGIVASPSAISDKHLTTLSPNVTDEINSLVINTDWDATKATIKCILEPIDESTEHTKKIEKTIYWELGNIVGPVPGDNIEIIIADEINLVYEKQIISFKAIIKNLSDHPINLKNASYDYIFSGSGLMSPSNGGFEGKSIGKADKISEDIFLAKGESYFIRNIPIGLNGMTEEKAKIFLSNHNFFFEFFMRTSDKSQVLAQKKQQVTFKN